MRLAHRLNKKRARVSRPWRLTDARSKWNGLVRAGLDGKSRSDVKPGGSPASGSRTPRRSREPPAGPVKVGEQVGNMWIVTQGLKPGERVVVEGVQKVKAGMAVNPKPSAAEPTPAQAASGSPSGT